MYGLVSWAIKITFHLLLHCPIFFLLKVINKNPQEKNKNQYHHLI